MDGRAAELENILDALLNLARSSNPDRSSGHPNHRSLLPYQQLIDRYIAPQELSQLHIMNVSVSSTAPHSSTSLQQHQQQQLSRHNNPLPDIIRSSSSSQPKRLPDIIEGVELSNPTVKTVTRARRKLSRKKCCPRVKVKHDTTTKHVAIPSALDDNEPDNDGASHERLREDKLEPASCKGSPQQRRSPRRFRLQGMFHDEHHEPEYGFREAGSCLRLIADAFHDDQADGVQQEHHDLGEAQHQGHHQRLLTALLRSTSLENVLAEAVTERPLLLGLILMSYLYFTNSSL